MISIVSPVYRAETILETLVSEIDKTMQEIGEDYEIILVDDRSPDQSWQKMKELKASFEKLKIYRLSRNFGQHPTIMAGLGKASGDWVVVMDCDMQDQPKEVKKLYSKAKEGFEIVTARRIERKDGFSKRLGSIAFYKVFNYLAGMDMNKEVANFGIYHKKVIENVMKMGDYIKFFPLFINWVGFKNTSIEVEHAERESGKSTYSLANLVSLAFNVIISFSDRPLRIFVSFGTLISILSFIIGIIYLTLYLLGNVTQPGFATIILSLWFLGGVLISCIGVLGIYLGKTFNQVKNRPIFIIDESQD